MKHSEHIEKIFSWSHSEYDHTQLCSFSKEDGRWYHDRNVRTGMFVVLAITKPNYQFLQIDEYLQYAIVLTEFGIRGCWFNSEFNVIAR